MEQNLIFWPVMGHLVLDLFLYAWLSLVRKQIRGGLNKTDLEARIAANLSNQYEVPILFYVIVGLIWLSGQVNDVYLGLAWIFILGRVLHSCVHTLTPRIITRGLVFTINFVAVYAMWGVFLFEQLFVR